MKQCAGVSGLAQITSTTDAKPHRAERIDLPPLKWSSLKYYFWMEDEIDGKEKAYG